jgi:hypothetical protein
MEGVRKWFEGWSPELRNELLAPFPTVSFLPKGGGGEGKKQGMAYIDARDTMRRLDDLVGPGNWSFTYSVVSVQPMMVMGILTVLGVAKCDAGEANAEGETLKSAVSDALKRCGVHFGIGRYLYELDPCWGRLNQYKRWDEVPVIEPRNLQKALNAVGYVLPKGEKLPDVRSVQNENAAQSSQDDRRGASGYSSGQSAQRQTEAPSGASTAQRGGISLQCEVCRRNLTEKIVSFCKSKGMPPLCMDHQRDYQPPAPSDDGYPSDAPADYDDPFADE